MPLQANDTTAPEQLRRANKRLTIINYILGIVICLIAVLYWIDHRQERNPSFVGRNSDAVAIPNIKSYRKGIHLQKRSMGVYYDSSVVRKFVTDTLQNLLNAQLAYEQTNRGFDYSQYKWVVGFYWMMKKDTSTSGSANKMDFYVIPTLVEKSNPHHVIDYYADTAGVYYHGKQTSGTALTDSGGDGNAFDEGQLWP